MAPRKLNLTLKPLSPFNGRNNKNEICLDNSGSYPVEESYTKHGSLHAVVYNEFLKEHRDLDFQ